MRSEAPSLRAESLDAEVFAFLAAQLDTDIAKLTAETSFTYDLGLSSFDALQLVCDVEDRFRCSIPDEKVRDLQTIGDLILYLRSEASLV